MTTVPPADDLNTVITAAVNARVEAAVIAAFSGDEVIGQMVGAALNREVSVRSGNYGREVQTTFLRYTIGQAIEGVTKDALTKLLNEERPAIEDAVRKELRKRSGDIAGSLVGAVADRAASGYGIDVRLRLPGQD